MNEEKIKYYSLDKILKYKAEYNIIYGERSNGKTTSVLQYALIDFCKSGYVNQLGIMRRWEEDFKGKNGSQMFTSIIALGWVSKYSKGEYESIYYYGGKWYLCNYDDKGKIANKSENPFAIGFSITSEEHYKSIAFPHIKTILFDEFMTRGYYIPDEFVKFQNLLSTIIRLRTNVTIFMCGNTVNKYCPYFSEMGLTNIKKQAKGTIDLYEYGESGLKVAVEYSDFPTNKKKSNKYFAFNNPKLNMITNGGWEIDIYPHLTYKYTPKDVLYIFYIVFDEQIIQGNIIAIDDKIFIYYHRKTTPIKNNESDRLIFSEIVNANRNYRYNFLKPMDELQHKILNLHLHKKEFFQDNELGELLQNYFKWCNMN